ncbi:hypothetical protein GLOIN_2v1514371 [Rhizophagus irregularis DAOM 181602=DAOM 197198]|uniref:Uncharacterized protein n=1 Tax=Rhizophagus irregularis (strain DAOM 181602 / DAOM 197198 / MUCL 43194) TaxID=747089 RepID=A0A2P4QSP3_RHIID|nr:hypothetical protein GLOIN_2v1514371 [Rhizophagus irregularis DAOM 181602=DAOM 197198]POG80645.1 hypothetical protein GLOIN_2v1514371 [Rhizophagus irregularis DAOM 181602=DAOM 197198]|eukprot:XP_025187511.1 hypothetical protein GLOIN_2v1514371 [Rhizophagus irregularis DAOM 181602=DAOM 197198]
MYSVHYLFIFFFFSLFLFFLYGGILWDFIALDENLFLSMLYFPLFLNIIKYYQK